MDRMKSCWAVIAAVGLVLAVSARGQQLVEARNGQKPEVQALLSALTVEKARTYKNMHVFPIRFSGKQAGGDWETMDAAVESGWLKISEKENAAVSEVHMENVSDKTIFLLSGEIVKGGKQTRMIRQDTILEPGNKVVVPVFCVERGRWRGGKEFGVAKQLVPNRMRRKVSEGADQSVVWDDVAASSRALGAPASPTGSMEEALSDGEVQSRFDEMHESLGHFSPRDTIGIAIADSRTGQVIGLEVFGRRNLFENLQGKLMEGYAADLVLSDAFTAGSKVERAVTEKDVAEFIQRALEGASRYEDTPGSGRGIGLTSGNLLGKGVALAQSVIHLSVQTRGPDLPVKPIVRPSLPRLEDPRRRAPYDRPIR